jgi:hypothetical protein
MSKRAPPPKFRHLPQDNNNNKNKTPILFFIVFNCVSKDPMMLCSWDYLHNFFIIFLFQWWCLWYHSQRTTVKISCATQSGWRPHFLPCNLVYNCVKTILNIQEGRKPFGFPLFLFGNKFSTPPPVIFDKNSLIVAAYILLYRRRRWQCSCCFWMMERILVKSEALQEQKEPRPIWSDAKKKLGRRKKKKMKKIYRKYKEAFNGAG